MINKKLHKKHYFIILYAPFVQEVMTLMWSDVTNTVRYKNAGKDGDIKP